MNRLDRAHQIRVLTALVEGNSINGTVRLTGVAKNTILKLLREVGRACQRYHDAQVRDLTCRRIQCDEIWAFCYAKQQNVPIAQAAPDGAGDAWTWVAIDADTKLVVSWLVGRRDTVDAHRFMRDVAARLTHRVQLTTDGLVAYVDAVDLAFAKNIDYAMLVKQYGGTPPEGAARPYTVISGDPDPAHVSTSYVERQNLTMRMAMRRLTRKTNGFSKKIENLRHAVALHYCHYNFVRIHKMLRVSPAMEAGITDRLWEIEDILELVDSN